MNRHSYILFGETNKVRNSKERIPEGEMFEYVCFNFEGRIPLQVLKLTFKILSLFATAKSGERMSTINDFKSPELEELAKASQLDIRL